MQQSQGNGDHYAAITKQNTIYQHSHQQQSYSRGWLNTGSMFSCSHNKGPFSSWCWADCTVKWMDQFQAPLQSKLCIHCVFNRGRCGVCVPWETTCSAAPPTRLSRWVIHTCSAAPPTRLSRWVIHLCLQLCCLGQWYDWLFAGCVVWCSGMVDCLLVVWSGAVVWLDWLFDGFSTLLVP